MRKLGKKLNYFTKVLLVFSLFFSNLSSMSVVFAYEGGNTNDFTVTVSEDNKILINYLNSELIDDTDEITATISEDYTYFDEFETSESTVSNDFNLTGLELVSEEGIEVVSPMLSSVIFDGTYKLSVSLYNVTDSTDLGTVVYTDEVMHDSGLAIQLFDSENNLRTPAEDGKYYINVDENLDSLINVKANILAGGLGPMDVFSYEDEDLMAYEVLGLTFEDNYYFGNLLFGEYTIPVNVELLNSNNEIVTFSTSFDVVYGTYALNTYVLNNGISSVEGYETYKFVGEEKDGLLYISADKELKHSVLELYNIGAMATDGDDAIKFSISNENGDLLAAYEEAKALDETLTIDAYLESIMIDDTTVLSLTSRDLVITYRCVLVGDIDGNQLLDQEDLNALINQVVGKDEVNAEKTDLNSDGVVDSLDAIYLHQVLLNDTWANNINEVQNKFDAKLNVMSESIVSGDEFKIDYVLSVKDYSVNGIAGLINYDEEMLELVSVESNELTIGNNYEGKFLYLNDDSLIGTEVVSEDQSVTIEAKDYVVLTMTFKALKSGVSTVEILEPEFFNHDSYYVLTSDNASVEEGTEVEDYDISVDVFVDESNDNNLQSLVVAGQEITLVEDVLEYTITVSNDVVSAVVEAVVANVSASVTSIVSPEELVEGENVITIVVTAENGDEKIYTIIVNREAAPEEEGETTQLNYQDNYTQEDNTQVDNEEDDEPIILGDKDDDDNKDATEKEEESNLSRIIIIILILLVIAALIYLIFKDDDDDDKEEVRKVNRDINKLKKDKEFTSEKVEVKPDKQKPKNNNNKKNNKKGR